MIKGLRCKLCMFRVPIYEPADVYCDNKSVVTNVSITSSILNKNHNSIWYHRVREAHTAGTIRVGRISGEYNKSDIGKKTTIPTKRQYELLNSIFMRTFIQLQRNPMDMMVKHGSPHLWKWVITSFAERNCRRKQVQRMSFEWINEKVARTPIHLQGLS